MAELGMLLGGVVFLLVFFRADLSSAFLVPAYFQLFIPSSTFRLRAKYGTCFDLIIKWCCMS